MTVDFDLAMALNLGLIDLAIKRNSLIGGDDFKSGQTKMKSVLVDFLVGAGIKVFIAKALIIFFFFFVSWVLSCVIILWRRTNLYCRH